MLAEVQPPPGYTPTCEVYSKVSPRTLILASGRAAAMESQAFGRYKPGPQSAPRMGAGDALAAGEVPRRGTGGAEALLAEIEADGIGTDENGADGRPSGLAGCASAFQHRVLLLASCVCLSMRG